MFGITISVIYAFFCICDRIVHLLPLYCFLSLVLMGSLQMVTTHVARIGRTGTSSLAFPTFQVRILTVSFLLCSVPVPCFCPESYGPFVILTRLLHLGNFWWATCRHVNRLNSPWLPSERYHNKEWRRAQGMPPTERWYVSFGSDLL